MHDEATTGSVPFREALRVWWRIGFLSFGGPAGQIALMHRIIIDEKRWLDEPRFLHALNYCMLLPGPEAQQLATYIGWLMHGVRGGIAAGLIFILPGAPYVERLRHHRPLSAALAAITAAVVGVIANLALWFGLHALFAVHVQVRGFGVDKQLPDVSSLDFPMLALICIAMVLVFRARLGVLKVLGLCAGAGIVWTLAT